MAAVQATPTAVPAQARSARASTTWPPPSSGLMHTRPWRSSPLASPAFSTLPPVILEASEESHENDLGGPDGARERPRTRSPSLVSQTGSLTALGYASRNGSGSTSALALVEGEASTSSMSLTLVASSGAHGSSSSQGHGSLQTHSSRPSRLSKSWRRSSLTHSGDLVPPAEISIAPPPRARTLSHGRSRSASFSAPPLSPSPTIPPAYSRATPRPPHDSDANTAKQLPSKSRDPASNWMSSSPFGPAQTPKFSRLAMASPAVVMPLSAKEYRKQKSRASPGMGKEKDPPAANRVTFIDTAMSAFQSPNGVPMVKVSPPQPDCIHQAPSLSGDHNPDRRSQRQLESGHPPGKPLSQATMSPRPPSSKLRRPRSRPHTPPRSSPLAAHPPISPKSSAGTFFSATSGSDDDTVPPARPRPRSRRRSYPDRLSGGARLSLVEAMNRLSQEIAPQHRLSGHSQTDRVNRLSVASQASGNTLFFEVGESEGEKDQVTGRHANEGATNDGVAHEAARTPVLRTQSLEDLSSTIARTGIEVVRHNGGGRPGSQSEGEDKGKRNVRTVRISDIVEVSPPPVSRRRKLTKSRPGPTRASTPADVATPAPSVEPVKEVKETRTQVQTQERRTSLLLWKSKGSSDGKAGASSGTSSAEKRSSTPTRGVIHLNETTAPTPVPNSHPPVRNGSALSKPRPNATPSKKESSDVPAAASNPDLGSFSTPRKSRRYTFSFFPSSTFNRSKREKSNIAPPSVALGLDKNPKGKHQGSVIAMERSGTDSTSTSICTITQGSQSTLVPQSPAVYDFTTSGSSGSQSRRGSRSSVPMLRRLNAQEMAAAGVPSPSKLEDKRDSTPSLLTNVSTATSSSSPRTPSYFRGAAGGEPFISRPSGLKESFTDTSEEDLEGSPGGGRTSRMCMHRRHESSPLVRSGVGSGEVADEDHRHLRPDASPRIGSRPGTSSSTLTTATEGSGSYLSFSTVPPSTTSSSSPSRSESPSPVADKRMSVPKGGEGEDHYTCAMCGHRSTTPLPARALSPSPTWDPELEGMHSMFTVPLVTVPAPALSTQRRASASAPSGVPRYANARKRERVGLASAVTSADVAVSPSPTRPNRNARPLRADASVLPVARARTTTGMVMNDETGTTGTAMPGSLSAMAPPPQKIKRRDRPQTAPAGTGDAARQFVEEAKAMRAREGGVDIDVLIGGDRPDKAKTGNRKSRFKTVLKGLLKWGPSW